MARATMENTPSSVRLQNFISDPLDATNILRQGDALACPLFNAALQKAIIDSRIQITGHIFSKSVQIIAYADDAVLIAGTHKVLVEGFRSLETAAMRIGLKINDNKTRYVALSTRILMCMSVMETELHTFERVHTFAYLGRVLTRDNNITEKVQNGIAVANRCYFSLQKHFTSNFISRITKDFTT
jgi:hypothetical protein